MTINQEMENTLSAPVVHMPPAWETGLARWLSRLGSPPLLALLGIGLAAQAINRPGVWWWAFYYVALVILAPVGYIIWQVHRGEITDFHMRVREQRIRPMVLMLAFGLAAWLGMWLGGAPYVLVLFAATGVLQTLFLLLVTLRWKISGHGTAVASLSVFLCSLYGAAAAPTLLAIPLMAWARVRLNRHDLAQTVAGALAGAAFMLAILYLMAIRCGGVWQCG